MPKNHSGPGWPYTQIGWPVTPEALYWGPRFIYERYGLPIYITESGYAGMDWVHQDGGLHDAPRIDYLVRPRTSMNGTGTSLKPTAGNCPGKRRPRWRVSAQGPR